MPALLNKHSLFKPGGITKSRQAGMLVATLKSIARMAPFSLTARYIFPVDGPPIRDGAITIDGERIVAVGNSSTAGTLYDLGDVAILPGLINAHTHLEFSRLARPLGEPGNAIAPWLKQVIAARDPQQHDRHSAVEQGLRECIESGTTALGEITTGSPFDYPRSGRPTDMTLFFEAIAPQRDDVAPAVARIQQSMAHAKQADLRWLGISPHAPYTAHPELISRLIRLSAQRELPLAFHLSESRDELRLLSSGDGPLKDLLVERGVWEDSAIPRGTRALDYLQQLRRAARALIVHGNFLDHEELGFLAAHSDRMSLIYCPRTHAYFRHDPYPLGKVFNLGVPLALGTDSRASNPDLSLWEELRFAIRQHPTVVPVDLLQAATLGGARALGRDAEMGTVTPGKLANLVVVTVTDEAWVDIRDGAFLPDSRVVATWYRGRQTLPAT